MLKKAKAVLCAVLLTVSAVSMVGCQGSTESKSNGTKTSSYAIKSSSGSGTFRFANGKVTISGNSHANDGTYDAYYAGGNSYAVYDNNDDLVGIIQWDSKNKKWVGDF